MTISIRLNDEDSELIKHYANLKNITVSELVRRAVLEKIEDEYDIKAYQKALLDFKENPVTYSLENVEKELGLI